MGGGGTVAPKRVLVEGVTRRAITILNDSKPPTKGHGDEWPGRDPRNWKQETLFDSTFQRRPRSEPPSPAPAPAPAHPPSGPPISPSLLAEQRRAKRRPAAPKSTS